MNEVYRGPAADRAYIREHLRNIRRLDCIEISTLPTPIRLSDPMINNIIDVRGFWDIVSRCLRRCHKRYGVSTRRIKADRYLTAQPVSEHAHGGFHDPASLGYQYWYEGAFVVTLNRRLFSKELTTVELVRCYLHDCLHHMTFRSFRRAIRVPASSAQYAKHRVPEVYREQYGINFRDRDGMSYSDPELTSQSPETINLNLLMDGIVVLVAANLMESVLGSRTRTVNRLEGETLKEIFVQPFADDVLPRAHRFFKGVTAPSKMFIDHWGGEACTSLTLQAMMNGNLQPLHQYFASKVGSPNAWEQKFKRPEFTVPPDE